MEIIDLGRPEGHWQPVRSAFLATAGFFVFLQNIYDNKFSTTENVGERNCLQPLPRRRWTHSCIRQRHLISSLDEWDAFDRARAELALCERKRDLGNHFFMKTDTLVSKCKIEHCDSAYCRITLAVRCIGWPWTSGTACQERRVRSVQTSSSSTHPRLARLSADRLFQSSTPQLSPVLCLQCDPPRSPSEQRLSCR